jgi:hypothetical protein
MWESYKCPFGCEKTHKETLASEAMAYWWSIHITSCPDYEQYERKMKENA